MDTVINIVVAALVFGVLFFGVGLKFLAKKDDEVKGSCSARNEFMGDTGCSICGREDVTGCDGSPAEGALAQMNKE